MAATSIVCCHSVVLRGKVGSKLTLVLGRTLVSVRCRFNSFLLELSLFSVVECGDLVCMNLRLLMKQVLLAV